MTPRRLDSRFLLTSCAATVVLGVCLYFLHSVQLNRQAEALLANALKTEESGQLEKAGASLDTYLAYRPDDTVALERCGLILERQAQSATEQERALQVLTQVLRRNPRRVEVREEVVRLSAKLGRFAEAAGHLELLRSGARAPSDVLEALAWAYLGSREWARAAETFAAAIRQNPDRLDNYLQLVELYANRLDEPERAQRVLDDLAAAQPGSQAACQARVGAMRQLAVLLDARGRCAEADGLMQRVEREQGGLGPWTRLGADIAFRARSHRRAADLARKAVADDSRDYRDFLWLAQILEKAGLDEQAEATLRRACERFADVGAVWVVRVEFLAGSGARRQAEAALKEAARRLPGHSADVVLARCHEALGHWELAQKEYQSALAVAPDDPPTLMHAARFCLNIDRPRQARPLLETMLRPAVQAPPELAAWARRELALALAAEDTESSFRQALNLLDDDAGSTTDVRARALVLAHRADRRHEALQLFEDSLGRGPLTPEEQYGLAQLYDAENNRSRSRELMLSLLAEHGRNGQFLAGHIHSLLARDDVAEARRWLRQLEKLEPDSPRTQAVRAEISRKSAS